MKDYKAIADSVLRRRDEYLEKKKKKRALFIRRTSIALSCCLVILAGLGIWRMDLLEKIIPSQSGGDYNVTEYTGDITAEPDTTTTSYIDGMAVTTAPETPDTAGSTVTAASRTTQSASSSPSAITTASAVSSAANVSTTANKPDNKTTATTAKAATTSKPVRTTTTSEIPTGPEPTTGGANPTTTTSVVIPGTATRTSTQTTTTSRTTTSVSYTRTSTTTTTTYYTRTSTTTTVYPSRTTTTTTSEGGNGGGSIPTSTTTTRYTYTTTTTFATTTTRYTYTTTTRTTYTTTTTTRYTYTTTTTSTTTTRYTYTTTTTTPHVPDQIPQHKGFYGGNGSIYFELTGTEADPSLIGGLLEHGAADPGTANETEYASYRCGNTDAEFIRAVKYDGDDRYFIGINNDWIPDDLSSLVSGMDMAEYMESGLAYDCVSGAYIGIPDKDTILGFLADNGSRSTVIGVSDNFLMNEYLSGNLSDPPEDDTDDLLMRVEISMPQLISGDKYYSSGYMKITRDGRLVFDMLKLKYTYNIGTEAAEAFAASLSP